MKVLRSAYATAVIIAVMALSACSGGGEATNPQPDTGKVIADAGQDQSVSVGAFVTLNGSKSTNANQTGLTYAWTLAKPASSSAALSNTRSVTPTLTVDVEGTYEATLIVTDARQTSLSSAPDTVIVTAAKTNLPPTANAGQNRDVFINQPVTLDGSGSRASGNKPLTYNWSFTERPTGSNATLSDTTAKTPSFTPDTSGPYKLRLVVNDGINDSTPASVTITAAVKPRPTADAGPAQSAKPDIPITLDGSKSKAVDNGPLTYKWTISSTPNNKPANLTNADKPLPTFNAPQPDPDPYVVQLIVNDGTSDSAPVTVNITVSNDLPVAIAEAKQPISVCQTVTLDGSKSRTRTNQSIATNSYSWSFESKPPITELVNGTSVSATLNNLNSVSSEFIANVAGEYKINLFVTEAGDNNTVLQSQTVGVTVTAASTHDPNADLPLLYTTNCGGCHKLTPKDTAGGNSDLAKKGYFKLRAVLGGEDLAVKQQQDHQRFRFDNDIAFLCNLFQAY